MKPSATLVLALLALTACKAEPKKTTGGTAQGEVLPGAVSDAMLPLDTLKSQAPLAPKTEGDGTDKAAAKPSGKPKAADKTDDEAMPDEPAAEPAPSTEQ